MKNKKISLVRTLGLLTMLFLIPVMNVQGADDPANVVGFNYKVEYPANQIEADVGYFDLLMEPGAEQIVEIVLSNPGKGKVTVDVSLNGTKTNSNGVVEYGETDLANDASLKFPFEEVVTGPETVTLDAGEVKKLALNIKMPATSYEGIILGGIKLKKADQEDDSDSNDGATVRNEFAYVVAMRLKVAESDVSPEIKLNQAFATQKNYRNSIGINLSNINSALVSSEMSIEAQVMKAGAQEVLYERKQTGMSMAPNSQMDFILPMNGEQMIPGDYTADVLVTIGNQRWQESLDFTITAEEADKYNKRDVGLVQERGIDWKMVGLIVAGVLGGAVVIFIIVKTLQKYQRRGKKTKSSRGKKRK